MLNEAGLEFVLVPSEKGYLGEYRGCFSYPMSPRAAFSKEDFDTNLKMFQDKYGVPAERVEGNWDFLERYIEVCRPNVRLPRGVKELADPARGISVHQNNMELLGDTPPEVGYFFVYAPYRKKA